MSKNETKTSVELSHHWLVRKLVAKMGRREENLSQMCRNGDEGAHLTGKGKRCDLKPLASVGGGDRQLIGGKTPTKSGASTVPLLPAHCANVLLPWELSNARKCTRQGFYADLLHQRNQHTNGEWRKQKFTHTCVAFCICRLSCRGAMCKHGYV